MEPAAELWRCHTAPRFTLALALDRRDAEAAKAELCSTRSGRLATRLRLPPGGGVVGVVSAVRGGATPFVCATLDLGREKCKRRAEGLPKATRPPRRRAAHGRATADFWVASSGGPLIDGRHALDVQERARRGGASRGLRRRAAASRSRRPSTRIEAARAHEAAATAAGAKAARSTSIAAGPVSRNARRAARGRAPTTQRRDGGAPHAREDKRAASDQHAESRTPSWGAGAGACRGALLLTCARDRSVALELAPSTPSRRWRDPVNARSARRSTHNAWELRRRSTPIGAPPSGRLRPTEGPTSKRGGRGGERTRAHAPRRRRCLDRAFARWIAAAPAGGGCGRGPPSRARPSAPTTRSPRRFTRRRAPPRGVSVL